MLGYQSRQRSYGLGKEYGCVVGNTIVVMPWRVLVEPSEPRAT